jgi:uncharacterized protein with NRDE domain
MCTLAIYLQAFEEWPVVIGANRDEFFSRPALGPQCLGDKPRIVGGRDLSAGGTWLGINEHGLIAGLLNRSDRRAADPKRRSRGLLCLDVLQSATLGQARELAARVRADQYNPFNLLAASRDGAFVAYTRGAQIESVELTPGFHLLTNQDVDDFECPKISRGYNRFAALLQVPGFAADPPGHHRELGQLLADHSSDQDSRAGHPTAICVHRPGYGTRSSSLIFLPRRAGADALHFFAPGPPCVTPYARVAITP